MNKGFSLLELLCALTLVVVVVLLGLMVSEGISRRHRETMCLGNLRQLGTGMALYAADHRGDWPIANGVPVRRSTSSAVFSQGEWFGIGLTYRYLSNKRLYHCLSDDLYANQQQRNWDEPTTDLWGSYALRGFGQTYGTTMSQKLAENAGRALLSCTFMYSSRSSRPRLAFHRDKYPVLFGDGSIASMAMPSWIDPANPPNIWDNTRDQFLMWDWFDSQR